MIELITNPNTPATILNALIVKIFGSQCYNWEPETIRLALMEEYNLDEISQFIMDKILAVIFLNANDQFYDYWEPFENTCKAFNHQIVCFEDMTPLGPEELTWGIIESKLNDDTPRSFGEDVVAYINTCFKSGGVSLCPDYISDWVYYKTYNQFDSKIEAQYQGRIKAYCILQINEIIRLGKEYFNKDLKGLIQKEVPKLIG